MELNNNENETQETQEIQEIETIIKKKKYDYGNKYKGRYDTTKYYKKEYHQNRYIEKKELYKTNALNTKNRTKKALEYLKINNIDVNAL